MMNTTVEYNSRRTRGAALYPRLLGGPLEYWPALSSLLLEL